VEVYGRISDIAGRTIQEFEDAIHSEFLDERRQQSLQNKSLYQKLLTLKPGVYKLDLSMRDTESKTMGTTQMRLAATSESVAGVACSPLILANRIEPVSGLSTNIEQFAYGDLKVIPNVSATFARGDIVGVYFHAYGVSIDQATSQPSLSVRYNLLRDGRMVQPPVADEAGRSVKFVSDRRIVMVSGLATDRLEPGAYRLVVRIRDKVSGQEASTAASLTIQ
jgi:hypothetical protein